MDEKIEKPEETPAEETPVEEKPAYIPRPVWQIWLARICLVLFVVLVILHYITIMRGGK